jgi:hypothetical protein
VRHCRQCPARLSFAAGCARRDDPQERRLPIYRPMGGGSGRHIVSEQDSGGDGKVEHWGQNRTAQTHPQVPRHSLPLKV